MSAFALQRPAYKAAELEALDAALGSIMSEAVSVAEAKDVVRSHVASGKIDCRDLEIAMAKESGLIISKDPVQGGGGRHGGAHGGGPFTLGPGSSRHSVA